MRANCGAMANMDFEMDALLTYAEQRQLCLWQYELKDRLVDLNAWEDALWDPKELREALAESPQESPGNAYAAQWEAANLADFRNWRLINPQEIYAKFEQALRDAEASLSAVQAAARHFKVIWIEKTLKRKSRPLRYRHGRKGAHIIG
jgi:hypothetical protein